MTEKQPKFSWWMAIATQAGTNDRMEATGPTKAAVDHQLYAQMNGPIFGTVRYFRCTPSFGKANA